MNDLNSSFLSNLLAEWCDRDHWRAFRSSRLWLWGPVAPVLLFLSSFLLRMLGDGLSAEAALVKGLIAAGCGVLCWAIGIWVATDARTNRLNARIEAYEQTHGPRRRMPRLLSRIVGTLIVLVTLALICAPHIEQLFTGERTVGYAISAILVKTICAGALVVPPLLAGKEANL